MINKKDLGDYINNFYGYGNWNSSIWFIGIEEGGGNSESEIKQRINSWKSLGKTDLIDNKLHHSNIGMEDFFTIGKYQNTWNKLITLCISYFYNKQQITLDDKKEYQKNNWGQLKSDNALVELFPLPSPNNSDWNYSDWSDIDYLKSRNDYYKKISNTRINYIKEKIKENKPKVIVMYASSMIKYMNLLTNNSFSIHAKRYKIHKNYISIMWKDNTCYVLAPQPSGARANIFWENLGADIKKCLNSNHK